MWLPDRRCAFRPWRGRWHNGNGGAGTRGLAPIRPFPLRVKPGRLQPDGSLSPIHRASRALGTATSRDARPPDTARWQSATSASALHCGAAVGLRAKGCASAASSPVPAAPAASGSPRGLAPIRPTATAAVRTECTRMGPCPRFTVHQGHWGQRPLAMQPDGLRRRQKGARGGSPRGLAPIRPTANAEVRPACTRMGPCPRVAACTGNWGQRPLAM